MYEQLMHELAAYHGGDGLNPSDMLGLPNGLRRIVTWLTRHNGANLVDLASEVGCSESEALAVADAMTDCGLMLTGVTADGGTIYSARMSSRVRARGGQTSERLRDLFK